MTFFRIPKGVAVSEYVCILIESLRERPIDPRQYTVEILATFAVLLFMSNSKHLQVFYVGGRKANERKDYHLEEGEELITALSAA